MLFSSGISYSAGSSIVTVGGVSVVSYDMNVLSPSADSGMFLLANFYFYGGFIVLIVAAWLFMEGLRG
jgi:hypothetical protein